MPRRRTSRRRSRKRRSKSRRKKSTRRKSRRRSPRRARMGFTAQQERDILYKLQKINEKTAYTAVIARQIDKVLEKQEIILRHIKRMQEIGYQSD